MNDQFLPPRFSRRAIAVWRRNFLVWRKLAIPSLLGNLADPMIYLFGLGYGLGSLLPQVDGISYIAFLASGMVCASTMNAASFKALYSGFSRMHVQKTWEAILNTPVALDDVLAGEWLPAALQPIAEALLLGQIPTSPLLHVSALLATALAAYWLALVLTRRRLLK